MPTTETDLYTATRIDCIRCAKSASTRLTDEELDDVGWHVERPHCTCDLLCVDCFENQSDQCDAVRYDHGAAA